jgi:hypothetical protein
MSEKQQHTAASRKEHMKNRYGEELHHKHNTYHNPYRQHCRTHPIEIASTVKDEETEINHRTGLIRQEKLRRIRKRVDKGRFH